MNITQHNLPSIFSIASDKSLVFDGFRCDQLVQGQRTPLYVYSAAQMRNNYQKMSSAFGKHLSTPWRIFYAYKGNPSPAVCCVFHNEGAGAEVVSEGELQQALDIGVSPANIVFNNVVKTKEELQKAIEKNVHLIIVDSETEFDVLNELATGLGRTVNIGFRVRPGITAGFHEHVQTANDSTKFGFSLRALDDVLPRAKASQALKVRAVHVHLGSQICDVEKYEEAALFAFDLTRQLREKYKFNIDIVDLGGGMGIQTPQHDRVTFDFDSYAKKLQKALIAKLGAVPKNWPTLYFEPNRALVGNAGILLGRIHSLKRDVEKLFVGTDTGYSALVRPMLYDAYHEIRSAKDPFPSNPEVCQLVGPLCETGDVLGKDVLLASPHLGDIFVVFDAGAYGFAQSSTYNHLPRPGEHLIDGGIDYTIREPEVYEDLWRGVHIPSHLEVESKEIGVRRIPQPTRVKR